MSVLKELVREIHRRSLWQVVGLFLAVSWGVLQVVEVVTESAGLPDWTPGMAFVLLLLGFPVVVATAFVQEGMPGQEGDPSGTASTTPGGGDDGRAPRNLSPGTGSLDRPTTRPSGSRRWLTWRNALVGGAAAFALLGVTAFAYWLMWSTGVGPVGNLEARGVFEEGEPVVLADFENHSSDPGLDGVVTEALRVDLASSSAITLVPASRIGEILDLMQRDPSDGLPPDAAREVAIRGGFKAVVEGEVGSAGSGYILTAAIRAAETGDALATFRRTADAPDDVIDAIDGLSQDIRSKAGESLRTIRAEAPLQQVTTASLEALRLYSEAERLMDAGEYRQAKSRLETAVELDPGFAMAWRKLAVSIQTAGGEPGEEQTAATRAYELRDRLTELERGNAVAYYHRAVTGDLQAQIDAYEAVLDRYPDDAPALNNLAIAYTDRTRHEDALELLERAIDGPGVSGPAHTNHVNTLVSLGRIDDARAAYERMVDRYPGRSLWTRWGRWWIALVDRDHDVARREGVELGRLPGIPQAWRMISVLMVGAVDAAEGKMRAVREARAEELDRLRRLDALWPALSLSLAVSASEHYVADDDERAAQAVLQVLDSGEFEALPVGARPWADVARALVLAGAEDRARAFLGQWAEEGGATAGSALAEARLVADALFRDEPGAAADALEAARAQMGCPGCYEWELAELNREAGRWRRASEAYRTAMSRRTAAVFPSFAWMRVVGHERLGMVHEAMGDSATAVEHYATFAELWADADPELQPRVRRAAERAAALGG